MKSTILGAILAAAVASAQVTYEDGKWVCQEANVAYCAGDSMNTDIIIRCNADKVGQPGRCSNNLAGQPPLGASPALCYQTSPEAGDAACEKNCVVYGDETSTLPADVCTPTYTATSPGGASASASAAPTDVPSDGGEDEDCDEDDEDDTPVVTEDTTVTTTICPETETAAPSVPPSVVPQPPYGQNTTFTYVQPTGGVPTGGVPTGPDATHTPTGPSGPGSSTVVPGAAAANKAAGALAIVGAFAAFVL